MAQLCFPSVSGSAWVQARDGDRSVRECFDRHYSRIRYRDGRRSKLFVGPGEKLVLRTVACDAIFVWRKFIDDSGQDGVNCAVFRNEGRQTSSRLILDAEEWAWWKWPGQRLYTYVDGKSVRSSNPGYCFQAAGWRKCGVTKWNRLTVLAKESAP